MIYFLIILGLVVFDQVTKWLIVSNFEVGQSMPILGIFNITYVQNTGAAFSLFHNNTLFLIVLTVIALCLVAFFWRKPYMRPYHFIVAVIVGGALGNFIDRVFRGYVVDFLDFTYFPVFNAADTILCCGVGVLALKILWSKEEKIDENSLQ